MFVKEEFSVYRWRKKNIAKNNNKWVGLGYRIYHKFLITYDKLKIKKRQSQNMSDNLKPVLFRVAMETVKF